MKRLLAQLVLTSPSLGEHYRAFARAERMGVNFPSGDYDADRREVFSRLFLDAREIHTTYPDYVAKNTLKALFDEPRSLDALLLKAFETLTKDRLTLSARRVYVVSEKMGSWQETAAAAPTLPFIAYMLHKDGITLPTDPPELFSFIQTRLSDAVGSSSLLCTDTPLVNAITREEGLADLHLHLANATEHDEAWQDALGACRSTARALTRAARQAEVVEFYDQLRTRPDHLRTILTGARRLRSEMCRVLLVPPASTMRMTFAEFERAISDDYRGLQYSTHPVSAALGASTRDLCRAQELLFLLLALRRLESGPSGGFAYAFHAYLLFQAWYKRLVSQQATQWGFDQFQKLTWLESREESERNYDKRLSQLAGRYGRDVSFLEGRFSPKSSIREARRHLHKIIDDHKKFRKNNEMELALVAHLIKQRDQASIDLEKWRRASRRGEAFSSVYLCRHATLRRELERKVRTLAYLHRSVGSKQVADYLTGIDAAANELHAGPEVFAPAFRRFRRVTGITRRTFHVGEDFVHLVSGMRAIYETVEFLELGENCRLGHATAVGIDPALWLERMEDKIYLHCQEWLDNLIFAFHLLREGEAEDRAEGERALLDAKRLYERIYGSADVADDVLLVGGWLLRTLDPRVALPQEEPSPLDDCAVLERKLAGDMRKKLGERAFEYFRRYHDMGYFGAAEEMIEVPSAYFNERTLKAMQVLLLRRINEKRIVLEALLTSNLRISFYKRYAEHHIRRWLGRDDAIPADALPKVVLGSDDPGIFDTNIRNEMTHLLELLNDPSSGLSSDEAEQILRRIHENGKTYRFRPPSP